MVTTLSISNNKLERNIEIDPFGYISKPYADIVKHARCLFFLDGFKDDIKLCMKAFVLDIRRINSSVAKFKCLQSSIGLLRHGEVSFLEGGAERGLAMMLLLFLV